MIIIDSVHYFNKVRYNELQNNFANKHGVHIVWDLYRVYKKKLNKFEIALNVAKRLKV